MKTTLNIILLLSAMASFGQSTIINIEDQNGTRILGAYYKDVNNYLNPFEGTWAYTNGNTSFKIVLQKKVRAFNTEYYEDLLIGEYQYIENGTELINTLPQLSTIYPNQAQHNIDGNSILDNNDKPGCLECNANEKRVRFSFSDPVRQNGGGMVGRLLMLNGRQALKVRITNFGKFSTTDDPLEFTDTSVPSGQYILIKQ